MTLRLPRAEKILALLAAAVGVIGIVSAATPEMADRMRLMRGVLPPGWPEGARILTMACAIGLVFLARSLARRRHRAWQLAIGVVIASAVAHLVKGLDFEESAISLLLLLALIHWRGRFDVPGDPASVRFGFAASAARRRSSSLRTAWACAVASASVTATARTVVIIRPLASTSAGVVIFSILNVTGSNPGPRSLLLWWR